MFTKSRQKNNFQSFKIDRKLRDDEIERPIEQSVDEIAEELPKKRGC